VSTRSRVRVGLAGALERTTSSMGALLPGTLPGALEVVCCKHANVVYTELPTFFKYAGINQSLSQLISVCMSYVLDILWCMVYHHGLQILISVRMHVCVCCMYVCM
jgi:hypothetical protein